MFNQKEYARNCGLDKKYFFLLKQVLEKVHLSNPVFSFSSYFVIYDYYPLDNILSTIFLCNDSFSSLSLPNVASSFLQISSSQSDGD